MDSLLRVADVLEINLGDVIKQAIQNVEKNLNASRKPAVKARKASS
jgi:hypothetical protein